MKFDERARGSLLCLRPGEDFILGIETKFGGRVRGRISCLRARKSFGLGIKIRFGTALHSLHPVYGLVKL